MKTIISKNKFLIALLLLAATYGCIGYLNDKSVNDRLDKIELLINK